MFLNYNFNTLIRGSHLGYFGGAKNAENYKSIKKEENFRHSRENRCVFFVFKNVFSGFCASSDSRSGTLISVNRVLAITPVFREIVPNMAPSALFLVNLLSWVNDRTFFGIKPIKEILP